MGIVNAQKDMKVVADAQDGATAVEQFFHEIPDVALIDIQMPKLDGIQVVQAIRAKNPEARLIILTTYDTDDDIERALKAEQRHTC